MSIKTDRRKKRFRFNKNNTLQTCFLEIKLKKINTKNSINAVMFLGKKSLIILRKYIKLFATIRYAFMNNINTFLYNTAQEIYVILLYVKKKF